MQRSITPYFSNRGLGAFEPLFDLHRQMNRLFDEAYRGSEGSGGQGALTTAPRLDVCENDQELCITADLPGIEASKVDLRLDGDVLTICGERSDENRREQDDFHIMERSYGRFQRSVQLPFSPDPDQVKARLENGVLNLSIPKQGAQQRSRRIELQGGDGKSSSISTSSGQNGNPGQSQSSLPEQRDNSQSGSGQDAQTRR
jgi:HSP20 family protein